MKFRFTHLVVLGLLSLLALSPLAAHAATLAPQSVVMGAEGATYEGGSKQRVEIGYSNTAVNPNSKLKFSVVREHTRGSMTFHEALSSEVIDAADVSGSYTITIPNVGTQYSTSTYRLLVESYIENEPTGGKFVRSEQFKIKPSSTPFISVSGVSLLQSNGDSYPALSGPTIYNPAKERGPGISTSTALSLVIDSNTDVTLHPEIRFKKLRSDVFDSAVKVADIVVKKGQTYTTVNLPVFDYVPGVYVGELNLHSDLIKGTIPFQYIVGGESATVGQVYYAAEGGDHAFTYDIYSSPIDFNRDVAVSPQNPVHSVTLTYLNGTKEVYTETKDVDFATTSMQSVVPGTVKGIDKVNIKVISKTSGDTLFEGSKDIFLPTKGMSLPMIIMVTLLLLVLIIVIISLLKKNNKTAVVGALMFLVLLGGVRTADAQLQADGNAINYIDYANSSGVGAMFGDQLWRQGFRQIQLFFATDDNPDRVFKVGERMSFGFTVQYITCNNADAFSTRIGFTINEAKRPLTGYPKDARDPTTQLYGLAEQLGGLLAYQQPIGNHYSESGETKYDIFMNTIGYIHYVDPNDVITEDTTHLYSNLYYDFSDDGKLGQSWVNYVIPLKIQPVAPVLDANASQLCGSNVNIVWRPVKRAVSYDVYRSDTQDGGYVKIGSTPNTSYADNVPSAKTVYYKLKAVSDLGVESDFSFHSSANAPGQCTDVSASASCSPSKAVVKVGEPLTWVASFDDMSQYNIVWSDDASGTGPSVTSTYPTEKDLRATFTATLKTDSTKKFSRSCEGSVDNGGGGTRTTLSAVTSGIECGGKVSLTWTSVNGASGYDVYRATSANGTFTKIASGISRTSYSDTASPSTTYYYKVKAIIPSLESDTGFSNTVQVTSSGSCTAGVSVSCTVNPYIAKPNTPVVWTAAVSGDSASKYNLTWSGDVTGTGALVTSSYPTERQVRAEITATLKSDSTQVFTGVCNLTVSNGGGGKQCPVCEAGTPGCQCSVGFMFCGASKTCEPVAKGCN